MCRGNVVHTHEEAGTETGTSAKNSIKLRTKGTNTRRMTERNAPDTIGGKRGKMRPRYHIQIS